MKRYASTFDLILMNEDETKSGVFQTTDFVTFGVKLFDGYAYENSDVSYNEYATQLEALSKIAEHLGGTPRDVFEISAYINLIRAAAK